MEKFTHEQQKIFLKEVFQLFQLPVDFADGGGSVVVDFSKLGEDYKLQGKKFSLSLLQARLPKGLQYSAEQITVPTSLKGPAFKQLYFEFCQLCRYIVGENLRAPYWQQAKQPHCVGFVPEDMGNTKQELDKLYCEQHIVAEKKPLLVDFQKSTGPYLLSIEEDGGRRAIFDGASQIGTLALGHNVKSKNSFAFRYELENYALSASPTDDEYLAHKNQIARQFSHTALKNIYYVNSGAEAIESAIQCCQRQRPGRKKLLAFEGSFHGRSLLSITTTYNPAKREPFEIEKNLCTFLPFAENKTPAVEPEFARDWLELWTQANDDSFLQQLESWKAKDDDLLQAEISSLLAIREELQKGEALCLLLEPMQGEGGDRFGSRRYYQAIRVLTRAFDTFLIIDEVQMGYGLGGPFFWHQIFDFAKADGSADWPDIVTTAKKAQLGVLISAWEWEHREYVPKASLYRGYLQGLAVQDSEDAKQVHRHVAHYLKAFQECVGADVIQNPRNLAYTFAFDLPSKELALYMIDVRFQYGALFYPAGERTLRFRLLCETSEQDLAQFFWALWQCFEKAKEAELFEGELNRDKFFAALPLVKEAREQAGTPLSLTSIWEHLDYPQSQSTMVAFSREQWNLLFAQLVKLYPEIVYSQTSLLDLGEVRKAGAEALWADWQQAKFSFVEMLWVASRAFGYEVCRVDAKELSAWSQQIDRLEAQAYERERRDLADKFVEHASSQQSISLLYTEGDKLLGLCTASPITLHTHLKMVDSDPLNSHKQVLYASDLTVDKTLQGKGLGVRLKIEQLIEAFKQQTPYIRGRNRYPEASAMLALNHSLGGLVIDENHQDYGGRATAYYVSHKIPSLGIAKEAREALLPVAKNKISLGNFVSQQYVNNLLFVRNFFPQDLRHFYLASGLSEAIDKSVKSIFQFRSKARVAVSVHGDQFAGTTAGGRSLGGEQLKFFDWPTIDYHQDPGLFIEECKSKLEYFEPEEILALYLEPHSQRNPKDKAWMSEVVKFFRIKGIPVVWNITDWQQPVNLAQGIWDRYPEDVYPDAVVWQPVVQTAFTALRKDYYYDKPLGMISTWEGDENSLNMLRWQLMDTLV